MGTKNTTLLIAVVIAIVVTIYYLDSQSPKQSTVPAISVTPNFSEPVASSTGTFTGGARLAEKAAQYPLAKEIVDPSGFINTGKNTDGSAKPVTIQSLIGKKVILLDIWTYSCINCQRTLPYLESWYDKYKSQGLEIIGLSVPEFEFEKDYGNVSAAVKKLGITWPVVLDNNLATARSYGMRYWPEEYLIDIDGYIVHKSVGEGDYDATEAEIQKLLNERMKVLGLSGEVKAPISPINLSTLPNAESPETYFGSERNEFFGNGTAGVSGQKDFTLPSKFQSNRFYLGGAWNISGEYAKTVAANSEIVYKYKARNVYFVAHAGAADTVTVFRDGKPLGAEKGEDVSVVGGQSQATIFESRLYKLIENDDGQEHTLRLIIKKPGLDAYTFTFG